MMLYLTFSCFQLTVSESHKLQDLYFACVNKDMP